MRLILVVFFIIVLTYPFITNNTNTTIAFDASIVQSPSIITSSEDTNLLAYNSAKVDAFQNWVFINDEKVNIRINNDFEEELIYEKRIEQIRIINKVNPKENIKESILLDIPIISQKPELPRGCEVTSLAMMLNYAGLAVDKMTLAEEINKVPYKENGLFGDPSDGFVGNMYTYEEYGFGVYNGPIFELANKYLPGKVLNLTGEDFEKLFYYLNEGTPVWVIANSQYTELPEESWVTWNTKNGIIKVTFYEHSVLLTGYDEDYVYINDPLDGTQNKKILKSEFEKAYNQMGKQAITYITD